MDGTLLKAKAKDRWCKVTEWGRNWRKLYVQPSTAWLALPYSARGLGYELIRVCDSDGRIHCGTLAPKEAVARLCQVAPRNRKQMVSDLDALLADGFLSIEENDGRSVITIRNFVEAQGEAKQPKVDAKSTQGRRKVDPRSTYDARMTHGSSDLTPRNHSIENDRLDKNRLEEKRREEIQERRGATTPTTTPPVVVPPPKQGPVVPDVDVVTDVLRRASKGKIESGIGQGRDELLALKAFCTQRAKEGCDVLAEFRTLGEAIDAGIVQKQLSGPPSLLRWLGKPEADGTRPAKALVTAIGIANEWKRNEEKKLADLEESRKRLIPKDITECERREQQAQVALARNRLDQLIARNQTKAPDSLASAHLAARTTNDRNDPSTTN